MTDAAQPLSAATAGSCAPTAGRGASRRSTGCFASSACRGRCRSDNGPPFASSGAGGLTRLAVHWLKLGIRLERIEPGQPQQNGRHERMHRTLKAETARPPAATPAEQQARFDALPPATSTTSGRTRRSARTRRPAATSPRRGRYPEQASRSPGTTPITPSGGCAPTARSSGAASSSSSARRWSARPSASPKPRIGDWIVRFAAVDLGLIDRTSRKTAPLRGAPAGAPRSAPGTNRENCQPCSRSIVSTMTPVARGRVAGGRILQILPELLDLGEEAVAFRAVVLVGRRRRRTPAAACAAFR